MPFTDNRTDDLDYMDDEEFVKTYGMPDPITIAPSIDSPDGKGHITDTKGYDPTKLPIISPEEIETTYDRSNQDANPEFDNAVRSLEQQYGRSLTGDEFKAACHTYATVIAEREEKYRDHYEGEATTNRRNVAVYEKYLLEGKPIISGYKTMMTEFEDSMASPVVNALTTHLKNKEKVIEIKAGQRVNIHYDGKVRIASDNDGKVIVIDNKKDVNLLRMKYRKEWIEKKFPTVTSLNPRDLMDARNDEEWE
jgi:hypothetical protein